MDTNSHKFHSLSTIKASIKKYATIDDNLQKPLNLAYTKAPISAKDAKERIWHLWLLYKEKKAINNDAYLSYLLMLSNFETKRDISSIMFGRHHAEVNSTARDRISNPYITLNAYYHRSDKVNSSLIIQLLKKFNIPRHLYAKKNHLIVPISELKTISIESMINNQGWTDVNIVRCLTCSVSLLFFDKEKYDIKKYLGSAGLTASAWEIAKIIGCHNSNVFLPNQSDLNPYEVYGKLNIKSELLTSDIFNKLIFTSKNNKYPTHRLADSLVKLIQGDAFFSSDSIKRIALFIDIANTFYRYNYPKYAFFIYVIVHEISLWIVEQNNSLELDAIFERFLIGSKETLMNALELTNQDLDSSLFFASPAMSGTHAFMIAKRIALQMKVMGSKPTAKLYDPFYYELNANEFSTAWITEYDTHIISCGPILNSNGIWPGVDLNAFILEKIVNKMWKIPTTIIVDTTTALYKNLKLSSKVKNLFHNGLLSIVFFESNQKFGLLHTDQAQFGRVFGLCSKISYPPEIISKLQDDAKFDFNQHMDMKIGAYLHVSCRDTLEEIKHKHFLNGALLSKIFCETRLLSRKINHHKYMLKNVDELYFLPIYNWNCFDKIIDKRESFGHYSTTLSFWSNPHSPSIGRLSANASDRIDTLFLAAQIYLANCYKPEIINFVLIKISKNISPKSSIEEKITAISLASNVINIINFYEIRFSVVEELYLAFRCIVQSCSSFKNRDAYKNVLRSVYSLKALINKENSSSMTYPNPIFSEAYQPCRSIVVSKKIQPQS